MIGWWSYTSETRKDVLINLRERRPIKHFGKGAGCLTFPVIPCMYIFSKQFVALHKQLLILQYFMLGNCYDNLQVSFYRIKGYIYIPHSTLSTNCNKSTHTQMKTKSIKYKWIRQNFTQKLIVTAVAIFNQFISLTPWLYLSNVYELWICRRLVRYTVWIIEFF